MIVDYDCPACGRFPVKCPQNRYREPVSCPTCGADSYTQRRSGQPGIPFVRGDVRSSYFSPHLNQVVGSRRDIREAQQKMAEDGFAPLGGRDLKGCVENAWNRSYEAKRDIEWLEREQAAGRIMADNSAGEEPARSDDVIA